MLRSALLIAIAFTASTADAGTFSIAPVRAELTETKRAEVLTLHNQDSTSVVIQASVHVWSQSNGEDLLADTRDVLATPPVFTLGGDADQVVRVALRAPADPKQERQYRLILQEVLPTAPSGFTGLRVALKISLPIFVTPSGGAKADVVWHAHRLDAGRIDVTAENKGNAHLQITDFTLDGATDQRVKQAVSRYVLPGSIITWQLANAPFDASATQLKLHAFTDQGEISTEIALD